jgi:HPt (histidine-containing phosphotransfer) domain-containing protein
VKAVTRLDPETLAVLLRLGGPRLVQQRLEAFLRAAPMQVEQARAALRSGRWLDLERCALVLRSSAGQAGALHLHHLARALESESARRNGPALHPILTRIETALGRFRVAVAQALAKPPPAAAG